MLPLFLLLLLLLLLLLWSWVSQSYWCLFCWFFLLAEQLVVVFFVTFFDFAIIGQINFLFRFVSARDCRIVLRRADTYISIFGNGILL